MPRLPKPKPLRQNRETRETGLVSIAGGLATMPAPTDDWLPGTVADWAAFWASALAQAVVPATDTPMIRRLFELRDERERLMSVVRKSRLVIGSKGQPRANPLYAIVGALDGEVRQLEDRIGLTPRSRLALGISLGDAVRSLADLNAELNANDDSAAAADVLLAFAGPAPTVVGPAGDPVDEGQPRPRSRRRTG